MLDVKHRSSYINGMSKLPLDKRVQILQMLCEGSSMRSISRVVGCSINTVTKLLEGAGKACREFHDQNVVGLKSKRIQCDEIWSFCYTRAKNLPLAKKAPQGAGDVYTFTAIDPDSKLICSFVVGERDAVWSEVFMQDLASRLDNRVQLSTDGMQAYVAAVKTAFGDEVDFAQLVKIYSEAKKGTSECIGTKKKIITGNPDPAHIGTSYVETKNQKMRMGMKRFARLSSSHSKKLANHRYALALYFVYYNWCKRHSTLKTTPAIAAGLTDKQMTMEDIVALVDARAPKTGRPRKNT